MLSAAHKGKMSQSADQLLKILGPVAFKLWVYLLKLREVGENEVTVVMSELARDSGVVSGEGGDGLGPVHSALRQLVQKGYITTVPEAQRRCKITILKVVGIQQVD